MFRRENAPIFLLCVLICFFSPWKTALANVDFYIDIPSAVKPTYFLVHIKTRHYRIHSTTSKTLATKIVTANQSHKIPSGFTNPLFFKDTYFNYYHPLYHHAVETKSERPSWLSTVDFSPLRPETFDDFLQSEKFKVYSPSAVIGSFRDHVSYFLHDYFPALDQLDLDQEKCLREYHTFFITLSHYAKETLESNKTIHRYIKRHEELRLKDSNYAQKLKRHEEKLFKDLTGLTEQMAWLLKHSRTQRNQFRNLEKRLKTPKTFLTSLLTDEDNLKIESFLQQYLDRSPSIRKSSLKDFTWKNTSTKISYTFVPGARYNRKINNHTYPCIRSRIQPDLSEIYPESFPHLKPHLARNYCYRKQSEWYIDD